MARRKKKEKELTIEERLEQALVPIEEQPYPVPENWCWTRLGYFIDFATDYVANGSFANLKNNVPIFKEENYAIMVKTADFANGFTHGLTYTNEHGYNYLSKSTLFGGELILSNIGSIGKVFRVPYLNRPMTLASNSVMIKCFHDSDYDWLYYYFLSPFGFQELFSITTGTAVLKFNKTDLKSIMLPVPPKSEQQRIIDRIKSLFAKLDEAKEKAQAVIDGFEARRAAILHKAFTGELTAKWRRFFKRTLDEWTFSQLGNYSESQYGYTESATTDPVGPKFLRITDIQDGNVNWNEVPYCKINAEKKKQYAIKPGDIVVARTGATTGKSYLISDNIDAVYASYLIRIVLTSDRLTSDYLFLYMQSQEYWRQISEFSSGIAQPCVNGKKLKELRLPIPSITEQTEIVRVLDTLLTKEQQAKETAETVLDQIETMKKSILARAFRGELGTNDPSEENAAELLKQVL